jgi:hypothetical protein
VGFNGDIVVFQGAALSELDASVGTDSHRVYGEWAGADGWQIVHVRHFDDPCEYERDWLEGISAATRAPVLTCNVFESDVAYMQGVSKAGYFDGWLDPVSTTVYLANKRLQKLADEAGEDVYYVGGEFGDQQMVDALANEAWTELAQARPGVAEAVVAWAREAGHVVPVEDVVRQLEQRKDPYVQELFFQLLDLIGLSGPAPKGKDS